MQDDGDKYGRIDKNNNKVLLYKTLLESVFLYKKISNWDFIYVG